MALGVVLPAPFFITDMAQLKMKTIKNPTEQRLRLASANGMFITYINSGETRPVPDVLYQPACVLGCIPVEATEPEQTLVDDPATPGDETKVPALVDAINQVLDGGDTSLLTNSGCPKVNVLKKIVGDHTADDRDLAWEQVQQDRVVGDAE